MSKIKGAIVVDMDRCKGCALCVEACPQNVIALAKKVNKSGYPFVEVVSQENCVKESASSVCPFFINVWIVES